MTLSIKKLLYATDLSENSTHALQYAIKLAKDNNAQITSIHVIEEVSSEMPILMEGYLTKAQDAKFLEERKTFALKRMRDRFEDFCSSQLPDDPECRARLASIEVSVGYPAEVILKKAKELNIDVIVMGTHGKGLISQTFLGSVAKRVLRRTDIPVFIVPLAERGAS